MIHGFCWALKDQQLTSCCSCLIVVVDTMQRSGLYSDLDYQSMRSAVLSSDGRLSLLVQAILRFSFRANPSGFQVQQQFVPLAEAP